MPNRSEGVFPGWRPGLDHPPVPPLISFKSESPRRGDAGLEDIVAEILMQVSEKISAGNPRESSVGTSSTPSPAGGSWTTSGARRASSATPRSGRCGPARGARGASRSRSCSRRSASSGPPPASARAVLPRELPRKSRPRLGITPAKVSEWANYAKKSLRKKLADEHSNSGTAPTKLMEQQKSGNHGEGMAMRNCPDEREIDRYLWDGCRRRNREFEIIISAARPASRDARLGGRRRIRRPEAGDLLSPRPSAPPSLRRGCGRPPRPQ